MPDNRAGYQWFFMRMTVMKKWKIKVAQAIIWNEETFALMHLFVNVMILL